MLPAFEEDEHESGGGAVLEFGRRVLPGLRAIAGARRCRSMRAAQGRYVREPDRDCPRRDIQNQNEIVSVASACSPSAHRDAWVARGVLGALAFGLLVPWAIVSLGALRSTTGDTASTWASQF